MLADIYISDAPPFCTVLLLTLKGNVLCICTELQVNTGNSILSELTKSEMSKKVGHFGFNLTYKDKNGKSCNNLCIHS